MPVISDCIRQIGGGKGTRNEIIEIAIMQSLFEGEEKDDKPFAAEYGITLCDECHHVVAFTFCGCFCPR